MCNSKAVVTKVYLPGLSPEIMSVCFELLDSVRLCENHRPHVLGCRVERLLVSTEALQCRADLGLEEALANGPAVLGLRGQQLPDRR